MGGGVAALNEREKATLRLLLVGHDAKSIAREQGLSVHTVNERLRDARAKLGVSSSREAARMLAQAEGPNSLGDKQLGVEDGRTLSEESAGRQARITHRRAWVAGGVSVMLLIIAALALSSGIPGTVTTQSASLQPASASASASAGTVSVSNSEARSAAAAQRWAGLLDAAQWGVSWTSAAASFRSQVPQETWVSQVRSVREPLGAVASRELQNAASTRTLPGAPEGEYEILQFQTRFANKAGAVETITLTREGAEWKVSGYYIR